jgi:hypothetical protein
VITPEVAAVKAEIPAIMAELSPVMAGLPMPLAVLLPGGAIIRGLRLQVTAKREREYRAGQR